MVSEDRQVYIHITERESCMCELIADWNAQHSAHQVVLVTTSSSHRSALGQTDAVGSISTTRVCYDDMFISSDIRWLVALESHDLFFSDSSRLLWIYHRIQRRQGEIIFLSSSYLSYKRLASCWLAEVCSLLHASNAACGTRLGKTWWTVRFVVFWKLKNLLLLSSSTPNS